MKRAFKLLSIVLGLASMASVAKADTVSGQISIDGTDSTANGTVTFLGPGLAFGTTAYGTLTNLFASPSDVAVVNLNSFSYTNLTSPVQVFSIANNGNTASFTLNSIAGITTDANGNLIIHGIGTLTDDGNSINGTFDLTTQNGTTKNVTFSATAAATPEPSSLLLLGTGLLGSAGAMFRRRANITA